MLHRGCCIFDRSSNFVASSITTSSIARIRLREKSGTSRNLSTYYYCADSFRDSKFQIHRSSIRKNDTKFENFLTCVTFLAEGLYIMQRTSSPRRTSRLQVKDIEREVENFCLKKPDLNELQIRIAILLLISNVVEVTNGLSTRGKKTLEPTRFSELSVNIN